MTRVSIDGATLRTTVVTRGDRGLKKGGMMMRIAILISVFVVGLFTPCLSQASDATLETSYLIVSDGTGKLSSGQLKRLADDAQETLNRVLAFWSADPGISRSGKIKLFFDPPRRDIYSSVFYWEKKGGQSTRVVRVFGTDGAPQMMAHKLTSAVFPQKDKLIRNMMGILTEAQVGNPLTFPMCGFGSDDWVLALLKTKSYIPLKELGPDHESWGMKDAGDGKLSIHDKAKQHKAYAETGSFGNYLFQTYGVNKIKQFHRLSHEKERPWQDAFGAGMQELEESWLKTLRESEKTREENVSTVLKVFKRNPDTACAEAQKLVTKKR